MTVWQWLAGGGATVVLGFLTWAASSSSARRAFSTQALTAGAQTWQEIAAGLKGDMEALKGDVRELRGEVERLEEDRDALAEENRRWRSTMGDLMRWLQEWAAWETAGAHPPPPFTAAQMLARVAGLTEGLWKK